MDRTVHGALRLVLAAIMILMVAPPALSLES